MEKYGFVYIWYDRKHKRYYIGSHWGYEGDGYICSSRWMRISYRRRPDDFKGPRILVRIYTNRKDLLEEEYRWLSLIKKKELGKRYYNLKNEYLAEHWTVNNRERVVKQLKAHKHSEKTKELIKEIRRKQKPPTLGRLLIGRNNKSGYKGVYKNECDRFRAQIRVNRKIFNLGTYSTPEEAALVYNIKAMEVYGNTAAGLNHINI